MQVTGLAHDHKREGDAPAEPRRADARRLGRSLALPSVVLCCLSVLALPTFAAEDFDPVESGGEVLRQRGDLPWYDAEKDEVQSVEVTPPKKPPDRPDVEQRLGGQQSGGNYVGGGLLAMLIQALALSLLGVVLIVGLVLLIRALLGAQNRGDGEELPDESRRFTSHIDRMEQLPVPLRRFDGDLLGETRRQYEAGNYNEAIIYLYSYLLVELDKAQRIRLLRGKTNRQYLWEIRETPPLRELVEQTMIAFEDVFFGDHDLDRGRFESCYHRLDEFHQHLELVPA